MQTPVIATGWSDGSFYGFGLEIARYRGLRTIGHGGGDPGYRAHVVRYPDQGLAVAVLANLEEIDPAKLAQGVADIYLASEFSTPPAARTAATLPDVSLSKEQLAGKAGLYRNQSTGTFGRYFVHEGKLMSAPGAGTEPNIELKPVRPDRFVLPGTSITIEFVCPPGGGALEAHATGAGTKPIVMQQMRASFEPSMKELQEFAGEYASPEVGVTYSLEVRDSGLTIHVPRRADIALQPMFTDAFHGALVDVAEFSRDTRGHITGFTVTNSGVRHLRFDRAK
jgi:hypothetical protein